MVVSLLIIISMFWEVSILVLMPLLAMNLQIKVIITINLLIVPGDVTNRTKGFMFGRLGELSVELSTAILGTILDGIHATSSKDLWSISGIIGSPPRPILNTIYSTSSNNPRILRKTIRSHLRSIQATFSNNLRKPTAAILARFLTAFTPHH